MEGGTSYTGLYGEALTKRGTFFKIQECKRVGISIAEVYEWAWKPAISICKKARKAQRLTDKSYSHGKVKKTFCLCDLFIIKRHLHLQQLKGIQGSTLI